MSYITTGPKPPRSSFKWKAHIQYKQSLYTQEEAIRYASQHGYNLVVKYEKRSGPLFDVLQDTETVFTSEDGYETVEAIADHRWERGPVCGQRRIPRLRGPNPS